jgi:hypothetical protein
MVRCVPTFVLALALALLAGCAGKPQAEVAGTVKIDGQPLQEGEIIFAAADGQTAPSAATIVEGKYSLQVAPGKKLVRINASRPTKVVDPVMGTAARESMIPEEFNVQTKLTADVKPGKQEGVDFEVKAIP